MSEQYFTELNGYLVKDGKAIHTYDTVASMKADTNLKIGTHVKTKGYYSVNDSGNAEYYIRTKTNEDTEDDMFIIALADENLVAELIDHKYNILKIGAKNDGETNCILYINKMLEKFKKVYIPDGTYYVNDKILLDGNTNDSFEFICDGTLKSDINKYIIELKNSKLSNIKINKLINENANGGGVILSNSTNNNTININNIEIDSSLACIGLVNENEKIITCNNFYGKFWLNKNGNVVYTENGSGTSNVGFNTENNFYDINMQSWNDYIIYLNDLSSNSETQITFHNCNLEVGNGIKSKGRVSNIGLYECRIQEMLTKNDCIYIINNMPEIEITGFGTINPSKIKFENITTGTNNTIYTNLIIFDNLMQSYYFGGGNIYYNHFVPLNTKRIYKFINLSSTDTDYTLTINNNGGIGNIIITDAITNSDITIRIPNYLPEIMDSIIIQTPYANNGHTVSIVNENNNGITYTINYGKELIILRGDRAVGHFKI